MRDRYSNEAAKINLNDAPVRQMTVVRIRYLFSHGEMMRDSAAQMAEDEPEHGLESFFGCGRHAGRVSQVGKGSRIIVED